MMFAIAVGEDIYDVQYVSIGIKLVTFVSRMECILNYIFPLTNQILIGLSSLHSAVS